MLFFVLFVKMILTLDVEEDDFFAVSVMILCSDDVFASVVEFHSVDDEGVVVAVVALHELHGLTELGVVVVPREHRRSNGDYPTCELHALALISEGALRFDDESWRGLSSI